MLSRIYWKMESKTEGIKMNAIKEFFTKQSIKHGMRTFSRLSDKNLIRVANLGKKIAREKEAKIISNLTEKWKQDHPSAILIKKLMKGLNKKCLDGVSKNLVFNAFILGCKKRGKIEKETGTFYPFFIVLSPTMRCNLRCIGCYSGEYTQNDDLDFETVDRVIEEAKSLGMYFFTITGGEPYSWSDLLKIFQKHNNCFFQTYTNGTLITKELAKKLAKLGNVVPAISVEGFEKETDERRGDGVFKKICQAMDNLKEEGVGLGFSATPTRINSDILVTDEFLDFYIEKGCYFGWFFQYIPIGLKPDVNLMATPEQREKLRVKIREWRGKKPIFLGDFWNDGPYVYGCIAGARRGGYLHINCKGDVEPCVFVHFAVDNIKNKTLKEVMQSDFFEAIRKRRPYDVDGNLLLPCMIIDNPQTLRDVVKETGACPTHNGAETIIKDPKITKHLDGYSKQWKKIADKAWKKDFPWLVETYKKRAEASHKNL